MTFGMRVAVTLAAFVTTVPLAACGSGDAGSEMRLTLTDDDCIYEGDETPAAGMFTVEVENQTSNSGAFALAAIAEGATMDDLEAFLEKARQQFQQGGGLPDPPAFYSQVVRVGAGAGTNSLLPADVPAGTYALTCFIDDPPTWRGYLAEQLDVTE
ncbi:MAG TPA: hypothetical protein VES61_03260 [Gaiellaceae bacterium]|nr:hypothetical protein [Gaiellaceae bacterium]